MVQQKRLTLGEVGVDLFKNSLSQRFFPKQSTQSLHLSRRDSNEKWDWAWHTNLSWIVGILHMTIRLNKPKCTDACFQNDCSNSREKNGLEGAKVDSFQVILNLWTSLVNFFTCTAYFYSFNPQNLSKYLACTQYVLCICLLSITSYRVWSKTFLSHQNLEIRISLESQNNVCIYFLAHHFFLNNFFSHFSKNDLRGWMKLHNESFLVKKPHQQKDQ